MKKFCINPELFKILFWFLLTKAILNIRHLNVLKIFSWPLDKWRTCEKSLLQEAILRQLQDICSTSSQRIAIKNERTWHWSHVCRWARAFRAYVPYNHGSLLKLHWKEHPSTLYLRLQLLLCVKIALRNLHWVSSLYVLHLNQDPALCSIAKYQTRPRTAVKGPYSWHVPSTRRRRA